MNLADQNSFYFDEHKHWIFMEPNRMLELVKKYEKHQQKHGIAPHKRRKLSQLALAKGYLKKAIHRGVNTYEVISR